MSYDDEMTLRFDGEQVRLIHPGRAHTEGDTITVFKRGNVIHAGDLFVTGAWPYMAGARSTAISPPTNSSSASQTTRP